MNENEVGVILEEVRSQYRAIHEGIEALLPMRADVATLKEDVHELKLDMKVVKAVLREHSADIAELRAKLA